MAVDAGNDLPAGLSRRRRVGVAAAAGAEAAIRHNSGRLHGNRDGSFRGRNSADHSGDYRAIEPTARSPGGAVQRAGYDEGVCGLRLSPSFPASLPHLREWDSAPGACRGAGDGRVHDLRAFTHDRHRTVDDRPFGGGEGMVLKPEPLAEALEALGIRPKAERDATIQQTVERSDSEGGGGFNPRITPTDQRGLHRLRKLEIEPALYQGTTSVVPQMHENEGRA